MSKVVKQEKPKSLVFKKTIKAQDATGRWHSMENALTEDARFIYLNHKVLREPNVSSHTLVDINGKNQFTSIGKVVLQMFGLLEYVPIEEWYTVRGGIVEHLTEEYIRKVIYPGEELEIESYELSDFEGFNQFREQLPFSGVLDKAIVKPFRMPIEIKSKDTGKYEWIVDKGQEPEMEVLQGKQLASLWGSDQSLMIWGFVPDDLEKYIREAMELKILDGFQTYRYGSEVTDYAALCEALEIKMEDLKWHHQFYTVNEEELRIYRSRALEIRQQVLESRRIPKVWFTHQELKEIKKHIAEY